jgi:hypothetical protein
LHAPIARGRRRLLSGVAAGQAQNKPDEQAVGNGPEQEQQPAHKQGGGHVQANVGIEYCSVKQAIIHPGGSVPFSGVSDGTRYAGWKASDHNAPTGRKEYFYGKA